MAMVTKEEIDNLYNYLCQINQKHGYWFNFDLDVTKGVLEGLLVNKSRYGYMSCPCRLAKGIRAEDRDIICPCNYRDSDVAEYGFCFCGLYVSKSVVESKKSFLSIPERRKNLKNKEIVMEEKVKNQISENAVKYPVWRCEVCGYLCARDNAPEVCPICGAEHDRFEKF